MLKQMNADRTQENQEAILAAADPSERERFLERNQNRILRLAAKLSGKMLTTSDDEWIISMMAVSQALDGYTADKGDFWPFAGVVVRSRLTDWYRSLSRSQNEIPVSPEVFSGETGEEEGMLGLQLSVQDKIAYTEDTSLKEEIEALQQELDEYGISFFDLAGRSPKAQKTRKECARIVAAMFLPPPLLEALRKWKRLPAKDLRHRTGCSAKTLEKYRSYLITASLMTEGDYPGLGEYIGYIRDAVRDAVEETDRENETNQKAGTGRPGGTETKPSTGKWKIRRRQA